MASLLTSIFVTFLVIYLLKYLKKYIRQLRENYSMPNPGFPLPFLGHSYLFLNVQKEDILALAMEQSSKDTIYRKFYSVIGPNTLLWLYHPETIEPLMTSSVNITKSGEYKYLEPWLGTGLLLSSHEKWRHRRKLLTPAFHYKILDEALNVFNRQASVLSTILIEDSKSGTDIIDLFPYVCRCTLDIILETAMGRSLDIQHNKASKYAQALQTMVHVMQNRQVLPWLMNDFLFQFSSFKKDHYESLKVLHSFTKSVIKDKREELALNESEQTVRKGPIAFLDLLLSARLPDGSQLSDSDVQEEVDTFMFEGHDTTACALGWTLLLIGAHPEVQAKLHEEQEKIFGDDIDADVTLDKLQHMKYLDACIKESLRLYPSVPIIARKLEEDCVIDDLHIDKGTTVGVFVLALHRNPLLWDDPEKFNPDRFFNPTTERSPYAYIPFSAGPRNCIGQKFAQLEEKTILSKLLRKFSFKSVDKVEDVKPVIEIITRPHGGIRSKITLK